MYAQWQAYEPQYFYWKLLTSWIERAVLAAAVILLSDENGAAIASLILVTVSLVATVNHCCYCHLLGTDMFPGLHHNYHVSHSIGQYLKKVIETHLSVFCFDS